MWIGPNNREQQTQSPNLRKLSRIWSISYSPIQAATATRLSRQAVHRARKTRSASSLRGALSKLLSSNGASTGICDELLSALASQKVIVQTLRNKRMPDRPKGKKKNEKSCQPRIRTWLGWTLALGSLTLTLITRTLRSRGLSASRSPRICLMGLSPLGGRRRSP